MNFNNTLRRVHKYVGNNSPVILTAGAVVGVAATGYLAVKAAFDAQDRLTTDSANEHVDVASFTLRDKIRVTYPSYIAPITVGCATITCVVMANRISAKRAAGLAAAYTVLDKAHTEYVDRVLETVGDNKEQKIRDTIAQASVDNSPPVTSQIVLTGTDEHLFRESLTGQYFKSSINRIEASVNKVNQSITESYHVTMSDFLSHLGLDPTSISDHLGWGVDQFLQVRFGSAVTPNMEPCLVVEYVNLPNPNLDRFS